jgi:hypothetical protein
MSPREIVDKSIHLDRGKSVLAETRIVVREASGKERSRSMLFRRKTIDGEDNTRVDFTAPADIKGLALLIIERPKGEADQHLYAPALRRVRRIRGSLKSQEFADTDFTYEDMERRDLDDFDYSLDGEETLDGRPCWKVEAKTKKHARSQYGRSVSWIDRENFLFRKIELYDRAGKRIKTLKSLKADLVGGTWTQLTLEMENLVKNRTTIYETLKIQYEVPLGSDLFSVNALGQ